MPRAAKSPRTRRAGRGFADSDYELSLDWLAARRQIRAAQRSHRNRRARSRVLLINGSSRSDQTCPGEMSKSYRLAQLAQRVIAHEPRFDVDFLDLSNLASEYGRVIYPCKACVSTAMPLCHWPCSCYPNHALGQTQDWMNEILELAGWDYPKHLAGRAFAVVVHGDAAGVEQLRTILCDWLTTLELIQAGSSGALGRYLGYYGAYATSHDDLDRDIALQAEVRNAAKSLVETVRQIRTGRYVAPDADLEAPRQK